MKSIKMGYKFKLKNNNFNVELLLSTWKYDSHYLKTTSFS